MEVSNWNEYYLRILWLYILNELGLKLNLYLKVDLTNIVNSLQRHEFEAKALKNVLLFLTASIALAVLGITFKSQEETIKINLKLEIV